MCSLNRYAGCDQQEIGDKEQEIRQHEESLRSGEAELQELQAKRNSLNDQRKELWRSIDDLKDKMKKMKDDKDRAQRGVRNPCLLIPSSMTETPRQAMEVKHTNGDATHVDLRSRFLRLRGPNRAHGWLSIMQSQRKRLM